MNFRKTQFFVLFACLPLLSFASHSSAETLEEAVHSALSYHPGVESARAGVDAAIETKREEFSGYFPEVSVSGSGGRLFGDNSTSRGLSVTRGDGYSYLWEGTLTARQMIFDGFETQSRIDSAHARKQSAGMNLVDIRETLALRAAQAYIDVMRAHTGLSMLKEQETKVIEYLNRIKEAVDNGGADETEHQQARDVKVILDGFITDFQGQVRAAESQYFEITGHFPEGEMDVPTPNLAFIPEDIEAAISYAQSSHPSLQSATYRSQSVEHDIETEKASLYPDVDGELSYLKSDKADIIGGEVIDARALVRLNWNFETGGAQLARIKRRKHEHQESKSSMNELSRQIETAVRLAYSELQTAQQQLGHQRKRNDLNGKLFDTYKVQFDGARINLLQLMQADNQLFNTELEKMSAEYRVLAAQYSVLASMGRLQDSLNLVLTEPAAGSSEASVIYGADPQTDEQN